MIWRIRTRHEFELLQRDGVRVRPDVSDPAVNRSLWSRVIVESATDSARLGFSIGREVGPAVVRNRLRRRLRAAFGAERAAGGMPGGWYHVGARPGAGELTFDQLRGAVASICRQARQLTPGAVR